ncbi:hypothetical protein [Candidatus Albibeggiatoa sp. nov. NOAA]|uniref:hypothetical protein n=1 Tax=Candidatus Albibeggiatoa sp. nov. NOAA TaxID=3162724 RepID=UPI0032F64266|nr:hypothetical protein [Thiotrichaceae bacterium]
MKPLLRFIQSAFTGVALLCLAYFAWQSQDVLHTLLAQTQWSYLFIAVLCWIFVQLISVQETKLQLQTLFVQLSYQKIYYIHVNRLPARYIPGGIWHTVSKMVDFHQIGVKKSHLGSLFLLESILAVFMSFLIGGSLVFYFRGLDHFWGIIAGLSALSSLLAIVAIPWLWSYQYVKLPKLNIAQYFKAASLFILIWTAASGAFISYLSAFPQLLKQTHLLEVAGSYIFSWSVGYLMIFAPQGIGVFEVVSGSLLNLSMQLLDAAIIIAGFRIITLFGDIGLWAITKLFYRHNI